MLAVLATIWNSDYSYVKLPIFIQTRLYYSVTIGVFRFLYSSLKPGSKIYFHFATSYNVSVRHYQSIVRTLLQKNTITFQNAVLIYMKVNVHFDSSLTFVNFKSTKKRMLLESFLLQIKTFKIKTKRQKEIIFLSIFDIIMDLLNNLFEIWYFSYVLAM